MLSNIITNQYAQFSALAEAWLATGARSFGIWRGEHMVARWPDTETIDETSIVAPIRVGNDTFGDLRVFGVDSPEAGARLAVDALLLARLLSLEYALQNKPSFSHAAVAAEFERARRVQRDLLSPAAPQIETLDIYGAARSALEVGGDFFDFICQPDRPFMFAIGDITGKGMSAALLMTMTRTAIRSKASFMPDPAPASVLRNANADLYDDLERLSMFATAFVGRYEPERRALIYANAGHAPVIYRPYDGAARLLHAENPALGILRSGDWRTAELSIRPGDLLVLATDGFSDARGGDEESFGIDRLLNLVDALAHLPAPTIAEALFDAVNHYSGGRPQTDDETLVVIKGTNA